MDDELQAIRQARLQELQQQGSGDEKQQQQQQQQQKAEEQRSSVLAQILTNEARERLARIQIVKPERARGVQELLIGMAQKGQIRQKVEEPELKDLLQRIADQQEERQRIVYQRRMDEEDW